MYQTDSPVMVGSLTDALEDYLAIIFRLLLTNKVARVRDIAKAKNVQTSSVSSALTRLAKEGLVEYKVREYVDLTEEGRAFAFRVHQRHIFLKRFLVDLLQVDPETAEVDACAMEHVISIDTLDRLASFAEYLAYCPSVDGGITHKFRECWLNGPPETSLCTDSEACNIWQHHSQLSSQLGIRNLSDMDPGMRGYVARLRGPDHMRKQLIDKGLFPATSLKVLSCAPNGSVMLELTQEEISLSSDEAKIVYIWVANGHKTDVSTAVETTTLANLNPGNAFRVHKLKCKGEIRQRLLDMGFTRGATGKYLREALLRDPIEIELGNYLLSLRRAEASNILVEEIDATA